jgi:type IV pilus assembly protein PilQ
MVMKATRPNMHKMPCWQALLAFVAWFSSVPLWAAQNALTTVSVAEGQNESQVIKIILKEALDTMPVSFTTSNPHRLVLDFPNTSNSMGRVQENLNSGAIKNYQIVQAGDRTRIVFNLNGPASHELRKDKNIVLAVLQVAQKQVAATSGPMVAPARFAETGKQRDHGIRDVDFRRGKNGEGRLAISLSDPGVGIDIQQKGRAIQVDFLNTSLPSPLQRRMDVADFATPTQMVEIFEQGKNTRMLVTPKGKWDYSAYQTGSQFIMEVRSLEDPQSAKPDKPIYTGEKLTLNFQNVEVRSVLQVIADFTGLNIIASDTVSGNLTLRLKDVPWDQALDIILRAKGLDKRATGNVIWVAPRDELAAKEKLELEAKKTIAELEPLVTRSYALNYIRADEAMAVVSGDSRSLAGNQDTATCSPSAAGIKADTAAGASTSGTTSSTSGQGGGRTTSTHVNRVLSDRGGASHDLTTNTLVVTDTLDRHEAVENVLKTVDLPTRQVMIEARIVLADDKFSRDLGVKLGFQGSGKSGNTNFGLGTYDSSAVGATTGVTGAAPATNINFPASNIGTPGQLGFTIFNASTAAILSLELQALEADNRGKIISNPRVVTTNLRPAVILQGEQIPVVTPASANSPATTTFKDALLCLLVSPQVLNNNDVILNVEVTKDARGAIYGDNVAINAKRIKTQVRVGNGETAVLGGIYEQTLRNDTNKVPFLGDLPVLGNLFKANYRNDEKSEMLIFLTPRILGEAALKVGSGQ